MEEASYGNAGRPPPSLPLPPRPPPPSFPGWPWPASPAALPPNPNMGGRWPAVGGFPHPSIVYGPPSQAAPFFPPNQTYTPRHMPLYAPPPVQQLLAHSPWTPLQYVVERIKRSPADKEHNELSGYKPKERMRLATVKLEQLTQIMQELRQLSGAATLSSEVEQEAEPAASSSQGLHDLPQTAAPPQPAESGSDLAEQVKDAKVAASAIKASLSDLLEPLDCLKRGDATESEKAAWQDYQARQKKIKQFRSRRKRKRREVAQKVRENRESFARLDAAADQWRAQHLALDIARNRMGQMAKAAHESLRGEQRQLERHAEALVLLERLQELRALRIAKLRKQGHVFPEDDAVFMASVQASVQQEAEQVAARERAPVQDTEEGLALAEDEQALAKSQAEEDQGEESRRVLEAEVVQYYSGPVTDMSKLIQVRRAWDSFLSPLGSAIPSHWVEAPKPSTHLWAQYLAPRHE